MVVATDPIKMDFLEKLLSNPTEVTLISFDDNSKFWFLFPWKRARSV